MRTLLSRSSMAPSAFAALGLALGAGLLAGGCADDEASVFDPAADGDPPELVSLEVVRKTDQRAYVEWKANEPVRAVVEFRNKASLDVQYAYTRKREAADSGITPLITVGSGSEYEILAIRLVDRAGNESRATPPAEAADFTFEPETIDPPDLFLFAMIDVGWGDALFLKAPGEGGKTCLIDAGHPQDGNQVRAFLEKWFTLGGYLDFASMSHVHEDHIGGFYGDDFDALDGLFVDYVPLGSPAWSVGTFLDIRDKTPGTVNGPYGDLLAALDGLAAGNQIGRHVLLETGASSETNEALAWGEGVRVDLLAAGRKDFLLPEFALQDAIGSVQNNDSMVYRVQYGDFVFLLMGDGEFATEQFLQNRWPLEFLQADVLKLGHHGSNDANSERFLEVVDPMVALISNAVSENPGVEHPYVLNRLRRMGIDYFASDRAIPNRERFRSGVRGDIVIQTDGRSFVVTAVDVRYE